MKPKCYSAEKALYLFQLFKRVNIATVLHKYLSSGMRQKWLYFTFPIIFFSGNILLMISDNVLYSSNDVFTYIKDFSNSVGLSVLYFLSYFLSGYYPHKFEEFVRNDVQQGKCQHFIDKKIPILFLILLGLGIFIISMTAGLIFYNTAKDNINSYWNYNLSLYGRIYYCIFLTFTWYHSISLLMMVLISGIAIYLLLNDNAIIYSDCDFNKNISVIDINNLVISNFSYGIFYIIGAIMFILNDFVAKEKYDVINFFSNAISSFFLLLIILILFLLIFIPLQELRNFMKKKKNALMKELNERISKIQNANKKAKLIEERNDLISQNMLFSSFQNKVIFVLSVLIPSIGVIFQIFSLFKQ